MNDIKICSYDSDDLSRVVELTTMLQDYFVDLDINEERKYFEKPQDVISYINQMVEDAQELNGIFLVAKIDNTIVGYIQGITKENTDTLHSLTHYALKDGWIGHLVVHKDYRGQGIAQKLIEKIRMFFKEQNCTQMKLKVAYNNTSAIRLYGKLGFTSCEIEMNTKI